MNIRYRITIDDFDERRPQILSLVQGMDEPVEIKNLILSEISENLTTNYNDINEIPLIVEKAKDKVIEKEIEKIYGKDGKNLIEKGKFEAYYEMAEKNAKKILNRRNKVVDFINILKLISGIIFLLGIILLIISLKLNGILKINILGYDLFNWSSFIGCISSLIIFLILKPVTYFINKQDYETIRDAELKKMIGSN